MAWRVSRLLTREAADRWYLAVSAPIQHQFLDALDTRVRDSLRLVLPADLSGTQPGEIMAHFARASAT